MPSYILPQVLVFQEFATQPTALVQPLRAVIMGQQFQLMRYPDKRNELLVGSYDPSAETCFAWPGLAPGGLVDAAYSKVFFENAMLQYFHDPAGDSSVITWVGPNKNRIRADSKVFQTANGFTRSAELLRDVKIGDAIRILANSCGTPVTVNAAVIGLIADTLAAVVAAASSDVDNAAATSAATSHAQTGGTVNGVDVTTVNGTNYDGLPSGDPSDTYTVEVIAGSTGGDATTALLRVTSASGHDNVSEVIPAAFNSPTAIGTRGLAVTFDSTGDDFVLGQKWSVSVSQNYTPAAPTSGGSYSGIADTSYLVEVTRGGKFSGTVKPQISVTTTTGIDISGPTTVSTSGSAVAIGTRGVTVSFAGAGLNYGDRYIVQVSAARPGPVRTLLLDRNLPAGFTGNCGGSGSSSSATLVPDLDVKLFIKKTMEITANRIGYAPLTNWVQDANKFCVQSGILAYDAEWQSGGILQALPVVGGDIFAHYRAQLPQSSYTVGTLDAAESVESALGTLSPDNPLAYGVYKALLNSNGEEVKYIAVYGEESLAAWASALEVLIGRDDVYSVVPLTQDLAVAQMVTAHVEAQSTPENGRWRISWLNLAATEVLPIYARSAVDPAQPVLATITEDTDVPGTQYTIVEAPNETFLTNGVRTGDTVRALYSSDGFGNFTYSEFTVSRVLNEETIQLVAGPGAPVNTPSKIEIWRTLTRVELGNEMARKPGLFSSRRAYLVWPDVIGDNGVMVPGYFLCAALAGLRSGVLPHQGLTNIEIIGFDDLSRSLDFFNTNQLNTMAASGYWIVTQDTSNGKVYTRHQLSTGDQSQLNEREQNITTNLDSISYTFLNRMKAFIGRGNVTPTMITILQGEILGIIESYKNTTTINRLGPQIIEAAILELRQHPLLKDRVVARIALTLPSPLNNLELHLIA